MASYFDQLVDDIRKAAKENKPSSDQHMPDAIVPNEWKEQYPGADYMISRPLRHWFGLEKEMFPPAEYWDEEQLDFMVRILTHLYLEFNFEPMLYQYHTPDAPPHELAYAALIRGFDAIETYYVDYQQPVYLCDEDRDTCPFGEDYCFCQDN